MNSLNTMPAGYDTWKLSNRDDEMGGRDPVLFLESEGWTCIGQNKDGAVWKKRAGYVMKKGIKRMAWQVMNESDAIEEALNDNERRW